MQGEVDGEGEGTMVQNARMVSLFGVAGPPQMNSLFFITDPGWGEAKTFCFPAWLIRGVTLPALLLLLLSSHCSHLSCV